MDSCKGMTVYVGRKDYFFPCTQTRKTAKLVREVAEAIFAYNQLNEAPNGGTLQFIRDSLHPGELTRHESPTHGTRYSIGTENSCSSGLKEGVDVVFLALPGR